ncbi:MAG: hypothetical protein EOO96_23785 [Pedobacter sp.]|nr:MAG: hypothetical protein EOO96_23785 [Pedobacter sp.]
MLKSIGFGIVLGAAAFFIPFLFKFIFAVLLIGLVFRLIFKRRIYRHFTNKYERFGHYYSPIVPIDNQWYKPAIQGNGTVHNVNINY